MSLEVLRCRWVHFNRWSETGILSYSNRMKRWWWWWWYKNINARLIYKTAETFPIDPNCIFDKKKKRSVNYWPTRLRFPLVIRFGGYKDTHSVKSIGIGDSAATRTWVWIQARKHGLIHLKIYICSTFNVFFFFNDHLSKFRNV